MADPAAVVTDEIIAEIEAQITVEYTQAVREIEAKLKEYVRLRNIKDRKWLEWVDTGKKTEKEYKEWLTGQLAIGQRWEEMRDSLAQDLLNVSKIAKSMAQGYMPEVYALNHDYGTFEVEKGSQIDTSYTLYSREAAERIFRDNPQMLPEPGEKVSQDIKDGKAIRWNNQHIQSVAMQSILQGNSISDIATRLANAVGAVGDSQRKAAIRNARTMMTSAQNAGRLDAYKRANNMGIKTRKQWLATLDMRTRHEHRVLDGMMADYDKPFQVDGLKIRYPGDPEAAPQLVYNCRCTLIAAVEGYESDLSDISERYNANLGGMSYDEWKAQKKSESKDILSQDKTRDAIRAKYIREYRGFGGAVKSGRDTTLDIDSKQIKIRPKTSTPQPKPFQSMNLQKAMGQDYEEYRAKVEKAPTRWLYEKYGETVKLIKTRGDGKYRNATNTIQWDLSKYEGMDKFSTIAHEYGHFFDSSIGKDQRLSFTEADLINERCPIGSGMHKTVKECPSASDEFLNAVRSDLEQLRPRYNDGSLAKEMMQTEEYKNTTSGIQDALDGAFSMQKKYGNTWGHGDRYYNRFYDKWVKPFDNVDRLKGAYLEMGLDASNQTKVKRLSRIYETASEAWANVTSAVTIGGDELKAWETYMPETLKTFRQIIGGLQ